MWKKQSAIDVDVDYFSLNINKRWQDHRSFNIFAEDFMLVDPIPWLSCLETKNLVKPVADDACNASWDLIEAENREMPQSTTGALSIKERERTLDASWDLIDTFINKNLSEDGEGTEDA